MSEVAKKHRDRLNEIKDNIRNWQEYWSENNQRYSEFMRFVFVSTQTDTEVMLLKNLQRPVIEFNVLEAYISRLRGEFSSQEPAIEVSGKDGQEYDPKTIEFVEGYMRHVLDKANKDGFEYKIYTDLLGGGFSAAKVSPQYTSEMGFNQDLVLQRVFDPCMTVFDMTAMKEDKSDGDFCAELYVMKEEEFKRRYPDVNISDIRFARDVQDLAGFNWSYRARNTKVIILADYYEKKKIKKKIVLLSNNQVMTMEDYNKFLAQWEDEGHIAQAPVIVGKPRTTEITKVCRYTLIENQILTYEETDYKRLPIIFIDGNSILCRDNEHAAVRQQIRPYVFHAKGAQKLKNFAGIMLANEFENLVQHKWMVPKDGIPLPYAEAYKNVQAASVLVYNQYKDDDPNVPLNPPSPVQRPPIPPELLQAFEVTDVLIQNILGSFDGNLAKMNDNQKSGIALQESITMSNATAKPYVVGFMHGLESIANCLLELIPVYYRTPRTVPTMDSQGNKSYVKINQDGGINLDYEPDALQVRVEAGVSFGMQKSRALQQIIALTSASPMFAQFINERGLPYVLDNVECRGIDEIKQESYKWMQELQKMKQEMSNKPSPEMMAMQVADKQVTLEAQMAHESNMIKKQQAEVDSISKMAQVDIDREKVNMEFVKILADMEMANQKANVERDKSLQKTVQDSIKMALEVNKAKEDKSDRDFEKQFRMIEHANEQASLKADRDSVAAEAE